MLPHQTFDPPESLARHARKCSVCTHPRRDDIEHDFLHWHSPERIALAYGIPHHSMIYRHAHALGLFAQRTGLVRHALESIIEQSDTCRVTANSVLKAIRAYSCLTPEGHWVEPPSQVVMSRTSHLAEETLIANSAIRNQPNPLKTKGDKNS